MHHFLLHSFALSITPVGSRYCSDIGFLMDLHRDIDQLRIGIEVTSLYNILFQYHNDVVAMTQHNVKLHVIAIPIFNVVLISGKDENAVNNGKHFGFFYFRSSRPEVFCKKSVLRNLAKFTGKYLCQSLAIFCKTLAQVFSCEFCKISKNDNTLKYQLHLCLPRFQNFRFQDFLGTPYVN